ncbi:histidine kinase N-terminal 7TM domain-containing protein [Candidatus Lucifugimonas marina]|uniref:histidine kinase n=1 Tax=Candidatus Lucifugimonas marina TaxID=3038979 RepID=A0AAJ5ZGE4_9CHLR|nr:response regulator [SAR202 cluster bacterium JH702]MDG0869777.1 response regulator [SAR202 cluster bacterium JH639]WFG34503.1 response regulator [SAR202 cluster bacterium JH545]WFG38432.1 response regulator [SAR202 cluster bacterium JH1073]
MAMFETSSFVASATFTGAIIALVMTALMWNRRQAPGAAAVAWLMIAAAIWSGAYGIEVLLEDIDDKLLLVPLEYVGISTVPVFWFITAAHLTGRVRTVSARLLVSLLVIPTITVTLTATNGSHNLMWHDARIVGDTGSVSVIFDRGVWFWVSWVYSYLAFFGGFGFLLYRAFTETSMFRSQMIATIAAGIIPLGANLIFLTDLNPLGDFDPTPMSFAASGVIVAYGYVRHRLFELVPVALDVLVENIPDAMFVLDSEGHILDTNPAAERLALPIDGHLIGRHLCDVLPGDQSDHTICTGDPASSIEDLTLTAGDNLEVSTFSATVTELSNYGDKGAVTGRLVILRDVTDQRKASEALRRLARITTLNVITTAIVETHDVDSTMNVVTSRLADLLPADSVLGLVFDPTSGEFKVNAVAGSHNPPPIPKDSTVFDSIILNPNHETGAHNLSETGGHLDDFAYRFAAAGLYSVVGHTLRANGETYGAIVVARAKSGSLGSAEVELMNAVGASVAQAIYGAQLVENLRLINAELVETQQQAMRQERLRALGQMASGITHDINNALSPVVGFSDMLLQNSTSMDDHSKKLLQLIRLAALDISRIVERMRQLYRDRESDSLSFEPVDVRQLVRETIELTRPRWRGETETGRPIWVSTDFARVLPLIPGIDTEIREALTNLVLNAVDAMPHGGRIVIAGYTFPVPSSEGAVPNPEKVIIDVKDEGAGMSAETAQRALEPFFTTKGDSGTGLGLPMVQQVMQRHSGTVSIVPGEESGTIVRLTFPVEGPTEVLQSKSGGQPSEGAHLNVLVVDDEPMLRMVVQEMLTAEGHTVEVAPGGPEASELVTENYKAGTPFDVVVSDIEMPELNGRMLAEFIETESPDTEVILMTGWANSQLDLDSISTRVVGILSKPPRLADITALMSVVARNKAPVTRQE